MAPGGNYVSFYRLRPEHAMAVALVGLALLLALAWYAASPAGAQDGEDRLPAPAALQVAAERGSLDVALDWDDVDGAGSYWVRWRVSGPGKKLNDGVHVQSSDAVITVRRYGEWVVRVQACNDAGCGAPSRKEVPRQKTQGHPRGHPRTRTYAAANAGTNANAGTGGHPRARSIAGLHRGQPSQSAGQSSGDPRSGSLQCPLRGRGFLRMGFGQGRRLVFSRWRLHLVI